MPCENVPLDHVGNVKGQQRPGQLAQSDKDYHAVPWPFPDEGYPQDIKIFFFFLFLQENYMLWVK